MGIHAIQLPVTCDAQHCTAEDFLPWHAYKEIGFPGEMEIAIRAGWTLWSNDRILCPKCSEQFFDAPPTEAFWRSDEGGAGCFAVRD